jgi:osmoprotectant transport system ATP-binding protein
MIALKDVVVVFPGGVRAVDGVSLHVERGGFLAVVGGSGSGKTTLLKTLNRLIEPTSGEIRIEGRPVGEGPAAELRRRIGYAFQGVGLFPHLSVGENIAITPTLLGWERGKARARTAELLELVRLPAAYAERMPDALSGGQRQRVGLARAIAAGPKVVLLDEPFGALDPLTRDALGEDYRRLHAELGLTTLMITHDVQEALLLADRIAVMRDGKLVAEGTGAELGREDADSYVRELMATPRRQAQRVAERLGGPSAGTAA